MILNQINNFVEKIKYEHVIKKVEYVINKLVRCKKQVTSKYYNTHRQLGKKIYYIKM